MDYAEEALAIVVTTGTLSPDGLHALCFVSQSLRVEVLQAQPAMELTLQVPSFLSSFFPSFHPSVLPSFLSGIVCFFLRPFVLDLAFPFFLPSLASPSSLPPFCRKES